MQTSGAGSNPGVPRGVQGRGYSGARGMTSRGRGDDVTGKGKNPPI